MAKHDIVVTSKMQFTKNSALVHVTADASADLDNGRLAVLDLANESVAYPSDATPKTLFLICTPEKLYEGYLGLEEFYNVSGAKVRLAQVELGDEFGTTAFPNGTYGTIALGDEYQVKNDGTLEAWVDGAIKFTVVEKTTIGLHEMIIVRRTV